MTGTEELHGGTAPLAALTTVFAPPCPTTWLLTTTKPPSQYPAFPSAGPSSCDPPSWSQNLDGQGFQYYSPAICPGGFVVGPSCELTTTRTTEGFPAVAPGETVAYCVPAGLTCTTDTTDFRGGVWGFAREGPQTDARVTVGPAIQIRWVDADLEILETHPLTPGRVVAKATTEDQSTETTKTTTKTTQTQTVQTQSQAVETQVEDQPKFVTITNQRTKPTYQTFGIITMSIVDGTGRTGQPTSTTLSALITDSKPPNQDPTGSITFVQPTETTPDGSLNPSDTSQSTSSGGTKSSGLLDRGTSIILIVMVSLLVGVAIWIISFVLIRRRKAGKLKGIGPSALVRLGIRRGRVYHRRGGSESSTTRMLPHEQIAGADIGFPELESGPPRGTTPNPAELEGRGIGDPSVRWSWISTVSRFIHAGRTTRQESDRSVTPTTTRSAWKRRTFRESFGEKANDPASMLARPEALRTRSTLTVPSTPSTTTTRGSSPWMRLSRDTFGAPKVPSKTWSNEQKVLIDGSGSLGLRKERSKN